MDVDCSVSADRAVRVARAVDFHLGGQRRVLCQGKPGVGPANVDTTATVVGHPAVLQAGRRHHLGRRGMR